LGRSILESSASEDLFSKEGERNGGDKGGKRKGGRLTPREKPGPREEGWRVIKARRKDY